MIKNFSPPAKMKNSNIQYHGNDKRGTFEYSRNMHCCSLLWRAPLLSIGV